MTIQNSKWAQIKEIFNKVSLTLPNFIHMIDWNFKVNFECLQFFSHLFSVSVEPSSDWNFCFRLSALSVHHYSCFTYLMQGCSYKRVFSPSNPTTLNNLGWTQIKDIKSSRFHIPTEEALSSRLDMIIWQISKRMTHIEPFVFTVWTLFRVVMKVV